MGRAKSSPVWDHFEEVIDGGDKKRRCLHCEVMVPSNKNTTNLINHLKYHHNDVYKQQVESKIDNVRQNTPRKRSSRLLESSSEDSDAQSDSNPTKDPRPSSALR